MLACVSIAVAGKPATQKLYRIVTEQVLMEEQPYDSYLPREAQAIADLKSVLSRWPQGLWLVSINGQLTVIKMGADGKPIGIRK
jgi:hypothetical protein